MSKIRQTAAPSCHGNTGQGGSGARHPPSGQGPGKI